MAERGALVLHGLTGSLHSLGGLPSVLEDAGFEVRAPLLPGHGTTVEDLETKRWDDWVGAAEAAYAELARRAERVVLVGLSMGGSLACRLAAEHAVAGLRGPNAVAGLRGPNAVSGLITVNPFIDPPAESFRQTLRAILDAGFARAPGIAGDLADPTVEHRGYDELPIEPLLSLSEALVDLLPRLADISCPTLIMTSRVDHVVPTVSSDVLAEHAGGPVERVWLERSWHEAALDYDRDEVERLTVEFALKVTAG